MLTNFFFFSLKTFSIVERDIENLNLNYTKKLGNEQCDESVQFLHFTSGRNILSDY